MYTHVCMHACMCMCMCVSLSLPTPRLISFVIASLRLTHCMRTAAATEQLRHEKKEKKEQQEQNNITIAFIDS